MFTSVFLRMQVQFLIIFFQKGAKINVKEHLKAPKSSLKNSTLKPPVHNVPLHSFLWIYNEHLSCSSDIHSHLSKQLLSSSGCSNQKPWDHFFQTTLFYSTLHPNCQEILTAVSSKHAESNYFLSPLMLLSWSKPCSSCRNLIIGLPGSTLSSLQSTFKYQPRKSVYIFTLAQNL